mmetsp:Transcript_20714/g.42292  ORF Transcript_20714/g.42292 Transcript_20714/m.42292 type:complete len:82 (-) Transcript_20714:559-804(-)
MEAGEGDEVEAVAEAVADTAMEVTVVADIAVRGTTITEAARITMVAVAVAVAVDAVEAGIEDSGVEVSHGIMAEAIAGKCE